MLKFLGMSSYNIIFYEIEKYEVSAFEYYNYVKSLESFAKINLSTFFFDENRCLVRHCLFTNFSVSGYAFKERMLSEIRK